MSALAGLAAIFGAVALGNASRKMSPQLADEIREAFGPNSTVFETMNTQEVIEDFQRCNCSIREWVKIRIDVESIFLDRLGTSDEKFNRILNAMRQRVAAVLTQRGIQ
jgi:hypothetical protein